MLIQDEWRRNVPVLEASQFLSLALLAKEAEGSLQPRVAASLPKHIVRASTALNGATALFLDVLHGGATAYADPYRSLDSFSMSERLFAMLSERKATLDPGDEYEIVDEWVEVLGFRGWDEWRPEEGEGVPVDAAATTEEEPLRERHPVAVW